MKDLTQGKIASQILKFTLPMLFGNVFQQLYNVVDSIIVGNQLGEGALSAVGASFPVMYSLISLVIGIASGFTIVISQFFGAKNFQKVKQSVYTMFIIVIVSSIIISLLGILFSEDIFRLIKLPENLIDDASLYLNIIMGGIITMFGMSAINSILQGLGDSKTPLVFLIVSSILNIGFDLLFVMVFNWGIAGVAIATVVAQGLSFLIALIYLLRTHELFKGDRSEFNFNSQILSKSIKIGLPSGLQFMFVAVGMVAVYRIVNQFDTVVIDAYSAAGRIDSFAIMPAMSFSVALTVFVGQNIGANKFDRLKKGLYSTLLMTSTISLIFTVVAVFLGDFLMRMFTPNPEIISHGYDYLIIVGSFYLIFAVMFTLNAVYRGAGDTIVPMFITLLALWLVRIPISWYLANEVGPKGIWWGIPLAWMAGLSLSTIYYLTGLWKKKARKKINS